MALTYSSINIDILKGGFVITFNNPSDPEETEQEVIASRAKVVKKVKQLLDQLTLTHEDDE